MKSTIEFEQQFIGRLAAFWDADRRDRRGNHLYDPAAQTSDDAVFPADYTEQQAIDECVANSACFGNHVCICRITGTYSITEIQRLQFAGNENE